MSDFKGNAAAGAIGASVVFIIIIQVLIGAAIGYGTSIMTDDLSTVVSLFINIPIAMVVLRLGIPMLGGYIFAFPIVNFFL
ncbi:hypothetical protein PAHA111176_15655 [Parendozoicomonas haliclonae]|uniref:Uncharacterized protein n=1 Tax=Parendozoicomonas haliclonae TaxID=1960125 RepID=A0A1X7AHD1_9GAMM|nr:hypothetical protein EHSB41UT_01253 [Parendozoicomonas haliclonae]